MNRQTPITDRNRYEFGGSIKWNITPDLNIQGRMPVSYTHLQKTHYNETYETPNMERLAKKGMMFTQAYACNISSATPVSYTHLM